MTGPKVGARRAPLHHLAAVSSSRQCVRTLFTAPRVVRPICRDVIARPAKQAVAISPATRLLRRADALLAMTTAEQEGARRSVRTRFAAPRVVRPYTIPLSRPPLSF